jgi:CO/xanthine dehydrogenase Mo-binding subunit
MDSAADELGIDPVELRMKNGLKDGDVTFAGERLKRSSFEDNLSAVSRKIGWNKKGKAASYRGFGVACGHWNVSGFPCSVNMKVNEDGTMNIITGAVNLTGTTTSIAQMVAEEMGVPVDDVSIIVGDTDTSMYSPPSGGSMITYNIGNAALIAARDAKQQLFEIAANLMKVDSKDLVMEDRMVYSAKSRDKAISLAQLSLASQQAENGLILGKGSAAPLPPHLVICAQAAEVEVDPQTGRVDVLRLIAAQDVGFAVNPMAVEGQIQGGAVQALGFAISEEYVYKNGEMLNSNFMDYKMPTALDVPSVEPIMVENSTGAGPHGLKGVGEPPHVPTAAAIANAVCDALNVRINELPLTPERVLAALKKNEG